MSKIETDLLWNPFARLSGWQSLLFGFIFMLITAVIGAYNNVAFDGALDIHLYSLSTWTGIAFMFADWAIVFLVMLLGVQLLKTEYRVIDLAGSLALARAPFLITAIFGFIATPLTLEQINNSVETPQLQQGTVIFMFIILACIAWNVAMTYNALKVTCQMKGKNLTLLVVLGLLIAEVITTFIKKAFLSDLIQ